ncbi:MAG TPA: LysR family transcriptional regulator, partial [Mycobacteriales bacterium]|nr:LysR family transcriptional regulator [Mycobacteriales bacterium]
MELREIETFLVLAEELHFGRSATRLHLSQSRVSQTIRSIESRIGGRLFDRTSRQVRLTLLGELLRDRLRPAFDEIRHSVEAVREVAAGITGELRISMLTAATGGPGFDAAVRAFAAAHPACRATVYEAFPGEALNRLRRGELDVVAHWLPLHQDDLTIGPVLAREQRALAVRVGHPLAVWSGSPSARRRRSGPSPSSPSRRRPAGWVERSAGGDEPGFQCAARDRF